MKVARTIQIKTDDLMAGDQITVKLKGFGKFTATAQKIEGDKILFLFDEVVTEHCMNEQKNDGGFDASDLKKWLNEVLLPAFSKKLQNRITELTIPTYGEVFGHDNNYYTNFEPDNDEQLPSMKRRGNRSCNFEGDWEWWWLRNAAKKKKSASYFAVVHTSGDPYYLNASRALGVRPEFWLVK